MKKYNVNFINQNISIIINEGTSISKACDEAGYHLNLVCNGKGTCGKCKVLVNINNKELRMLACQTIVSNDVDIYITESDYGYEKGVNILHSFERINYQFNPSLKKKYYDKKEITKVLNDDILKYCSLNVLRKFSKLINDEEIKGITFVYYDDEIIDIQPDDTIKYLYGLAVDIGTTSVVMYVYDLNKGCLFNSYSDLNGQITVGADVISRINYGHNDKGLNELSGKIFSTLNKLVQRAEFELPNLKENMYNITLCGNSTMQHLFFGIRPDMLGISPFTSVTKDYIECYGSDVELNCTDNCKIVFLPLLGGYVGADTTAVLLTIDNDHKHRLVVDLGTNGEIAIGNTNKYIVASTACGPALEGGSIECGMRGTLGAIEKIKIENDEVHYKVIGNKGAIGICGSGIIDAIAELLRNKIIDATGKMLTKDEFEAINPYSKLNMRLAEINGINSFIIYEGIEDTVYISQKDIRQVQLAKSAIFSGTMTLLKEYDKNLETIDEIIVSGAFGNYIDIENAVYIGLLPNAITKIRTIGNGAGKGTSLFLLDRNMKEKCNKIVSNSVHFELANNTKFAEDYINNMNFIK